MICQSFMNTIIIIIDSVLQMGNPNSKSFKNSSLNNQFNFVNSGSFQKRGNSSQNNRDNDVLTKFTWSYGGNSVFVTGSFNNWSKNIPLDRTGDQFSLTMLLPRSIHQYKFIVDGQWRFSPEEQTMPDNNGHINNYIDTTNFEPIMNYNMGENKNNQSGQISIKNHQLNNNKQQKKLGSMAPVLPIYYEYCSFLNTQKENKMGKQYAYDEHNLTDEEIRCLFTTPHSLAAPTHVQLGHIVTSSSQLYDTMAVTSRCQQKYTTNRLFTTNKEF